MAPFAPAEGSVERLKHLRRTRDAILVVWRRGLDSRNEALNSRGLHTAELTIGDTDVVNDLGDGAECRILAGGEPGNEIQSPMAIVVLGGLLTAVMLNMVVVPALFLRYGAEARSVNSTDTRDAEATLALEAR